MYVLGYERLELALQGSSSPLARWLRRLDSAVSERRVRSGFATCSINVRETITSLRRAYSSVAPRIRPVGDSPSRGRVGSGSD